MNEHKKSNLNIDDNQDLTRAIKSGECFEREFSAITRPATAVKFE